MYIFRDNDVKFKVMHVVCAYHIMKIIVKILKFDQVIVKIIREMRSKSRVPITS